jgi:hypothetical protein
MATSAIPPISGRSPTQRPKALILGAIEDAIISRLPHVTAVDGEMRTAAAWVGRGGCARVLRDALVTAERYQVALLDRMLGGQPARQRQTMSDRADRQ